MRNYISINQHNFIAIGKEKNIKVDAIDGILFDWIQGFTLSGKALKKLINNELFIWVNYKTIREDNPMTNINTNDVVGRRLNKLVNLGILKKYQSKEDGNKIFICITEYAHRYLIDSNYLLKSSDLPTQKSGGLPTQKSGNSKLNNSKLDSNIKNKQKKLSLSQQIESKISEYQNINLDSFKEWLEIKKFKTVAPVTKILNMLSKYDLNTQQQIIDNSIMNGWAGLFEPKQQNKPYNAPQLQTLNTDVNVWDMIEQQDQYQQNDKQGVING